MKNWFLMMMSTGVLFTQTSCAAMKFPEGKLSVQVVDDAGTVITNAKATAYFYEASSFSREYVSDTNGIFTVQGRCDRGIGGRVEKEGYYGSGFGYAWGPDDLNKVLRRFEPWNPTIEVVMKEIRNPVGMKYLTGWKRPKIPEYDKPIGFDLEKGDWVSPFGLGVHSDFIFTAKKIPDVILGTTLELSFSNEFDGIMEFPFDPKERSWFKWPYEAPLVGYINNWSRYRKSFEYEIDYAKLYPNDPYWKNKPIHKGTKHESNLKDDTAINYIFRVRSVVDENENLVKACYGKIQGEIKVARDTIHLSYWFNPHWTRNLEDDPERNVRLD
jgi:hypothetical protein